MPSILCPRCGETSNCEQAGARCWVCGQQLPILALDPPAAVAAGPPSQPPPPGEAPAPWAGMFDELVLQQWQQPPLAEGTAPELLRNAVAEQPDLDVAGLGLRLTEEEVHAFVGPGASYYLACWHAPLAEGGQPRGFNVVAALFAGLWLPYRKLYSAAGFVIACLIGWALAERFVFLQFLGLAQVPGWWALATVLVFGVVVGRRANHLYWIRARDAIWQVRQLRLPSEQHYRELARRGGTSVRAAVAIPLAGIVIVAGAHLLFDRLPFFNEIARFERTVWQEMEKQQKIHVVECRLARQRDGNIKGTVTEQGGEKWDVLRVWPEGRQVRWYFMEPVARMEARYRKEVAESIGDPVKSALVQKTGEETWTGKIETQGGVVCDVVQTPDVFPPEVYWQINENSFPSYIKVAARKDNFNLTVVRLDKTGKGEWRGEATESFGARYSVVVRTRAGVGGAGPGEAQRGQIIEWELSPLAGAPQVAPPVQWQPPAQWQPPVGPGGLMPPGWGRPKGPFGPQPPFQPNGPFGPKGQFPFR